MWQRSCNKKHTKNSSFHSTKTMKRRRRTTFLAPVESCMCILFNILSLFLLLLNHLQCQVVLLNSEGRGASPLKMCKPTLLESDIMNCATVELLRPDLLSLVAIKAYKSGAPGIYTCNLLIILLDTECKSVWVFHYSRCINMKVKRSLRNWLPKSFTSLKKKPKGFFYSSYLY